MEYVLLIVSPLNPTPKVGCVAIFAVPSYTVVDQDACCRSVFLTLIELNDDEFSLLVPSVT